MTEVKLLSLNVRGLQDSKKRRELFLWLKQNHKGSKSFILLQETHSKKEDELLWEKEWGAQILFSHGTSQSRGVAILFPKVTLFKLDSYSVDLEGRKIQIHLSNECSKLCIINVYAPTQDKADEQYIFMQKLYQDVNSIIGENTVIGGDFNLYLDPTKDKFQGHGIETKASRELLAMMVELSFIDI